MNLPTSSTSSTSKMPTTQSDNRTGARRAIAILSLILLIYLLPSNTPPQPIKQTDVITNLGTSTPNNTLSATPLPKNKVQNAIPDPRFDNIAIVIKSGKDVVDTRWPAQFNSFLRSVKNFMLVGDANLSNVANTGVNMHDVVHGIVEEAEARIKQGNSDLPPKSPFSKRRIEDTQGWKDDAHKFLPGIRLLYKQYPKAHWYMIGDDDVYIFVENLHYSLSKLDHNAIHYMGLPTLFMGCDGVQKFGDGPLFGHGGSGIIISQGALKSMMNQVDQCIPKYRNCWAGDIRVALCMRDAGIKVSNPLEYQLHQIPPTLEEFRYPHDACIRPITFHHLKPEIMQLVHQSIDVARKRVTDTKEYWDKIINPPHLYAPNQKPGTTKPYAQTSVHYSPVHFDDVYQVFVNSYRGPPYPQPNKPLIHLDHMRNSDAFKEFYVDPAKSLMECHDKCVLEPNCRAWDLHMESRRCRLIEPIPKLEAKLGSITGVILDRFVCKKHSK